MGTAVGIDLGTTNTVVAVVRDGKPEALPDDAGGKLIPSFVSFHPNGGVLVGRRARERRKIDAENTVYSVKRLIGRRWQSDEVQRAKGLFPFKLKESAEHLPLVVARGAAYALHTISSLVLKRAKKVAEKALGGAVDNAVITVPASFNELQRAATKNAGTEAGLKVLRILNEPTAAALAYGLGRAGGVDGGAERVAVYDLGGGTFDLTLLDLSGSVIEVIATAGDNFLGGDDIDHLILGQLVDEVLQQTRVDPRNDVQLMERLRAEAEQIKIGLSSTNEVAVEMQEIGYGAGGIALKAEFSMRRSELEVLAAPLVERSIDVCKRAMELGRLDVDAFDRIILVGGSTRMPLVRQMVEAYFGKLPLDEMNPDEVVALGAAIQAQSLAEADERRGGAIVQAAARRFHAPSVPRATPPALPGAKVPLPSDLGLAPAAGGVLPPAAPAPRKPPGPPPITVRGTQTVQVGGPPVPAAPAPFPAFITGDDTPPLSLPNPSVPEPPMFPPPPQAADAFARTAVMAAISPKVPDRLPGIAPAMRAPLLIDVTPLTLAVETVGGFVDSVIPRNTAVPSAQTRTFTTSKDNQTDVVVRVCQGESQNFGANVFLGELQLSGIRAARRGEASIEVTFELDADGMLQVRALDLESRKEIRTSMKMDAAQSAGG